MLASGNFFGRLLTHCPDGEMVDTRDSKSLILWICGFKSRSGHHMESYFYFAFFFIHVLHSGLESECSAKRTRRFERSEK